MKGRKCPEDKPHHFLHSHSAWYTVDTWKLFSELFMPLLKTTIGWGQEIIMMQLEKRITLCYKECVLELPMESGFL